MKKALSFITVLFMLATVSSCVKEQYDAPPTGGKDPDVTVNTTIRELKALYTGTTPVKITDSLVIMGVVSGDDRSGNLYKQIVIQDSTGGISIRIDGNSLYTEYPVGRRLFIKCQGLYLGDYGGLIQLGASDGVDVIEIPLASTDRSILKGIYGLTVTPTPVSINQLGPAYQNMLVELNDVEFATADANKTYADGVNKVSQNRTLKDCSGGTLIVRTSGYASFANAKTPAGKGKFIGIYTEYNTDGQMLVRDPADLSMTGTRCGGTVVSNGDGILGITSLHQGSDVTLPSGSIVKGIVISDRAQGNTDPKNLVIQDSTGGIVVRFSTNHTFNLNDEVQVDLSGLTLTSYNGLLEVTNTPSSVATVTGTGTITPRVVTIQQVLANSNAWESTLLTIQNATVSGTGTTYSGSKTLNDGTGSMTLYTRSQATFSTNTLPTGSASYTGYLGDFNGVQLQLRTLSDVQ